MAKVQLDVGGHSYEIACRDGEEAHFRTLAAMLDAKAADVVASVGALTETRLLLFVGLLMADEMRQIPPTPADALPPPADTVSPIEIAAVAALAERVERIALALEERG